MVCRQCQGIEKLFDDREAARDLKSYRRKGPPRTTRMLIDAVVAEGVADKTLLDIGGGVGAIQHELLKSGASIAVSVEASTAYVLAAKEEGASQGHEELITYHHGNFVDIAPQIEAADVVTLDRVICCYHDVEQLVGLSSERAKKLYGLVYPHDNWLFKVAFRLFNLILWLRRSQFRVFVHPTNLVDALVGRNGLRRRFYGKTLLWQVVVYSR